MSRNKVCLVNPDGKATVYNKCDLPIMLYHKPMVCLLFKYIQINVFMSKETNTHVHYYNEIASQLCSRFRRPLGGNLYIYGDIVFIPATADVYHTLWRDFLAAIGHALNKDRTTSE
jgi:hypothetical protein